MFIIDLVANLRELYLRNCECVYVRTDLYMKLHTELGRLCSKLITVVIVMHYRTAIES